MLIELFFQDPILGLSVILAILLALTVHEFSHGWAASLLGDDTAEASGRLTLNPLPHIDPFGLLALILMGFGWGKPVPVNPYNFKQIKRDSAIVAFAGPLSNFVFAVFVLLCRVIFLKIGLGLESMVYDFFDFLIYINLILMLFNLIPLSPLDGSKILFSLLPDKYGRWRETLEINGPKILLFLVFISILLPGSVFGFLRTGALVIQEFLYGLVRWI